MQCSSVVSWGHSNGLLDALRLGKHGAESKNLYGLCYGVRVMWHNYLDDLARFTWAGVCPGANVLRVEAIDHFLLLSSIAAVYVVLLQRLI